MRNRRREGGFTFLGTLVVTSLVLLFFSVVYVQVQVVSHVQRKNAQLMRAINVAINEMENLKFQENPLASPTEKEVSGMCVFAQVEEFSPSLYKLKVVVKDQDGKEILSLQTLRRK